MNDKQPQNYRLEDYVRMAHAFASPTQGDPHVFRDIINDIYLDRMQDVLSNSNFLFDSFAPDFQPETGNLAYAGREILQGNLNDFYAEDGDFRERARFYAEEFHRDADRGRIARQGVEAYATYLPIHFFIDRQYSPLTWGIYISEEGVLKLAAALRELAINILGDPIDPYDTSFIPMAYQILLRHELVHFKVESFTLNAELFLAAGDSTVGSDLYVRYLYNVYAPAIASGWKLGENDDPALCCLEESIANATVLNSHQTIGKLFAEMYPSDRFEEARTTCSWNQLIIDAFFEYQPASYKNHRLEYGPHPKKGEIAGGFSNRQLAVSFLCNQIMSGCPLPSTDIPFYAYSPDNYFLRAENLVPIYIVKSLRPEDSFIHGAPPKRKPWERFLRALGYEEEPSRGRGDHRMWFSKFGLRPLTLDYKKNELSYGSFRSSLEALGIKESDYRGFVLSGKLPQSLQERLNIADVRG